MRITKWCAALPFSTPTFSRLLWVTTNPKLTAPERPGGIKWNALMTASVAQWHLDLLRKINYFLYKYIPVLIIYIKSRNSLSWIVLFEKKLKYFSHFMFPLHRNHSSYTLYTEISCLQIHNSWFHINFTVLAAIYIPLPSIQLSFLNNFKIFNV